MNFIEFLSTFATQLSQRREALEFQKRKYENSIGLLQKTNENLKFLQKSLQLQEGDLSSHEHELEEILKTIKEQGNALTEQEEHISREEAAAAEKARKAEHIKNQCQAQLDAVWPDLESAKDSLKRLSKLDISELKSLHKPPATVKLVIEAVCMILKVPPARYKKGGEFIEDF